LRSEASIIIDRPIGEVFTYATNPNCWPEWVSGVETVVRDSGAQLDVGATFGQVDMFPGHSRTEAWECIEYEPPRVLTCRRITGSRPCTVRLVCVAVDGQTKLAMCSDAGLEDQLGGGPEIERAMAGRLEQDLVRLKRILERRNEAVVGVRRVTRTRDAAG
jgi:uncharacterized protein YndB with AHSA1/START domain